jgi:hypothetical protein
MKYKINEDFIYSLKDNKFSLTSALPDMAEIYIFEGISAQVLKEWFTGLEVNLDKLFWETRLGIEIQSADWEKFHDFAIQKSILKEIAPK